MSERWPGGIISATAPTVSPASAPGIWTMDQANYYIANGTWPYPGYGLGLWAWGRNVTGTLGLGNTTNYSSPKQVGTLTTWLKVSSGSDFTQAVKTDGTLWSWGSNAYGQLGLNNTTAYSSPKQVGALTNWLNIAAGDYHTLATKTDGTLWSWGYNIRGQLGTGNTTNRSSPVQIGLLTSWLTVSASGYGQSYSIKTDGTIWSWGNNASGQLGLGNLTYYSSPKQIGVLTNWLKITSGKYSVVTIKTDSSLWAWGKNNYGQLGLGNTTNYSSPKQVGALTNWLLVSGNYKHVMSIKTDGTLWGWGWNTYGQLGLGNTTYQFNSPNQIGALTTWQNPTTGIDSSAVKKTDGTLWSFGRNTSGQLGLGNTTNYSSPKQVGTLTNWSSISGYYQQYFGIAS